MRPGWRLGRTSWMWGLAACYFLLNYAVDRVAEEIAEGRSVVLLFSFELCELFLNSAACGVVYILLFSFELCRAQDHQAGARQEILHILPCYFLLNYAGWGRPSSSNCSQFSLAIFFWIMHIFMNSSVTLPKTLTLLFSFELCGENRNQCSSKLQGSLLFSFELCAWVEPQRSWKFQYVLLFSFELCQRSWGDQGDAEDDAGLLFSFELCANVQIPVVWEALEVLHLLFSFELCLASQHHTTAIHAHTSTCYFLLNYAWNVKYVEL